MGILSPVSKPLMKRIQKDFGGISKTQRLALEMGTAKHEEQLFTGKPDWNVFYDLPAAIVSPEAQAFIDGPVQELCRMVTDWQVRNSEEQDMPQEVWSFLREKGFFGLVIPKEYGGHGFSEFEHGEIIATLGTHSMVAALTTMVPNSLGPGMLILKYGTDAQKKKYLPKLASGEYLPCFALTEPFAGSDAFGGMRTTGKLDMEEGADGLKMTITLNGEKRYITLAPVSNLAGVAFRAEDPKNVHGKGEEAGITCALVERGTPGLDMSHRHRPMDIPFMNGPIFLDQAKISADDVIGGPAMIGRGDEMLMDCLGIGRSISLPNMSLASGRLLCTAMGAYTRAREQFGYPLSEMKSLHGHLARIAAQTYMINAGRTAMAQRVDQGEKPSVGSAILKVHTTTAMADMTRASMRLQGGKAIMQGVHNLLSMLFWGVPIAETVEGDNEMTKTVLAYAQGLKKCHPQLSREIAAAESGDLKTFEKVLVEHVGAMCRNILRCFTLGLTGAGGAGPEKADAFALSYFRQMNRVCAAFNVAANVTMAVLGGAIQKESKVSERLGLAYSHMEMAAYTLRDYSMNGSMKEERPLVEWIVKTKLHEAEQELKELIDNYGEHSKLAKAFLRVMIFPLGLMYKKPTDKLTSEVAMLLTRSGPVRERLTKGTYIPLNDPHNAVAQAERTLRLIETVEEPLLAKLKASMNDRKAVRALLESRDSFAQMRAKNLLPEADIAALENVAAQKRRLIDVDYYKIGENFRKGIGANPL